MNCEILSIENAQKIARLEKENQELSDIVIKFDKEINRQYKIIKDAYKYLDKETLCFKGDKEVLKNIIAKAFNIGAIRMPKPYTNNFNRFSNNMNSINQFNKKLRALKKYCPQAYKYLLFEYQKEVKDGIYEGELPTSKEFKFVYGQIKIKYEIKNGVPYYQDLEPSQFFMDGYRFDLDVYKGIYYRNNRDKFMINLFMTLKNERNYTI